MTFHSIRRIAILTAAVVLGAAQNEIKVNKPLIYRWAREDKDGKKKIDMLRRVPGPKSATD